MQYFVSIKKISILRPTITHIADTSSDIASAVLIEFGSHLNDDYSKNGQNCNDEFLIRYDRLFIVSVFVLVFKGQ